MRSNTLDTFFNILSTHVTGNKSTQYVQRVEFEETKAQISELKGELNFTRHQLNELRRVVGQMNVSFIHDELRRQKEALGNLTTLVRITNDMLSSWVFSWRGRVVDLEITELMTGGGV